MNYYILFILLGVFNNNLYTELIPDFKSIPSSNAQNSIKQNAFAVLRNKCNTCHGTKKRLSVFTSDNMDSLSKVINKQVFIKNKMPKGKKNQLSKEEELYLFTWLETLK